MVNSFPDGVAVVAGGTGGLGAGICLALAVAGCDVAVTYRSSERKAQSAVSEIEALQSMGLSS
jgi:3-oxoacyl-[acyl-carrier protein] reductase